MSDIISSEFTMDQSILVVAGILAQMRSKDPKTRVGACVYDPKNGSLHLGYNGFSPHRPDLRKVWENKEKTSPNSKYVHVIHAEVNALRKAYQSSGDIAHCVLYCTHSPCFDCMERHIGPSGIKKVLYCAVYDPLEPTILSARTAGIELTQVRWPELSPRLLEAPRS